MSERQIPQLPGVEQQDQLFTQEELPPDWKNEWRGLPDFSHKDLEAQQSVLVHLRSVQDREAFAALVGQRITSTTKFIWYPKAEIGTAADKVWTGAKGNPQYPVYIISKGRWDTRLTSKAFEFTGVPYHIVIEPQEYEQYAAVIDPAKILTLPFSNLGLGGIPARNWVWDHAAASGAARHWIFDDNISGFCRFHDNLKVEVDSGILLKLIEDFCDRYENVPMAAFNYDYFAPRKQGARIKPITLNTRCYSGILLRNDLVDTAGQPIRWRGRYNEDTDLSLRILKDGATGANGYQGRWCTALFNAFLMYKKPTLTMKGGNTDQLYAGVEAAAAEWTAHAAACATCTPCVDGYANQQTPCAEGRTILSRDGRWLMAESLREQHPDVTTVERKWGRWQHQVDYRRFARNNRLVMRPGVVVPDDEDYGFELGAMPTDEQPEQPEQPARAPSPQRQEEASPAARPAALPSPAEPGPPPPAGPSALDFATGGQPPVPSAPPAGGEGQAAALAAQLTQRGHRLLTQDGRLFISSSSQLTDAERAAVKLLRDELVQLADRVPDERRQSVLLTEPPRPAAMAFVGTSTSHDAWRPDAPPDLTGIDQIVVNFATTGTNWAAGDRPVGVTVASLDGQLIRFLPFGFAYGGNHDEATIKRWAQEQLRGKRIVNAKTRFDVHMSRVWGVDLEEQGCTFSDIQHTAALLDDHRKRFALDVLAAEYLPDMPTVARVDEARHADYHAAEVAERERHTVLLVSQLTKVLQPQIDDQELRAVHDLEDRVIPAVVEMEKNGAPIDMALLEQYGAECDAAHNELMWEIAREVGFAFEHTAAGWTRLLEKLGLPIPEAFDEAALTEIDHPLVRKGQLAAQYASLNAKTFKAYKEQIVDGILRYEINQLRGDEGGTVSGRFSIGYVQQVPNHDNHSAVFGEALFPRRLFISHTGRYFAADAAQIEYRLFAHYANNPQVLAAYAKDPLLSFHKMTFGMMQRYKPDMLYVHQKSFNFAKQYGAKSIKLAIMMKFITEKIGAEIRRAKRWDDPRLATIHEIERAYSKMMPEGDMLLARAAHLAKPACDEYCRHDDKLHRTLAHRGYVKTLLGRRSRFPDSYKTYIGLNRVLQGTGADILKTKLVELHNARKATGLLLRMTVHDEITGDARDDDTLPSVMTLLNQQSFPELRVPILWDGKVGATWADCK